MPTYVNIIFLTFSISQISSLIIVLWCSIASIKHKKERKKETCFDIYLIILSINNRCSRFFVSLDRQTISCQRIAVLLIFDILHMGPSFLFIIYSTLGHLFKVITNVSIGKSTRSMMRNQVSIRSLTLKCFHWYI